jgi:hypothetical protein
MVSFVTVVMLSFVSILAVNASDGYGYSPDAVDEITPTTYDEEEIERFITTANLNFRSGPSIEYPRMSLLQIGTIVTMVNYNPSGFSVVDVDGTLGYVYTQYIRRLPNRSGPLEIGMVEMIHWSEVRQLLPMGSIIQVYDVRTGLTYYIRNFAHNSHADVEALTREDTQIIRNTSNGRWTWDPRPVLVTWPALEGRVIAASIHTMPHGVSTIHDNGMAGHICLHFLGTVVSNRTWNSQMQAAIREAYNYGNSR